MNAPPQPPAAAHAEADAERRLAAWLAALSPTSNPMRLGQRLRFLRWTESDARARLGAAGARLFDDADDPEATELLRKGLTYFESAEPACGDAEIPFAEIFGPIALVAADGLPEWLGELQRDLVKTLAEIAAPALLAELRRGTTELLPPRREPYAQFVNRLRKGGLCAHLERLPVLARDLARQLRHWHESTREFASRLDQDRTTLAEIFPGATGGIEKIDGQLGDAHRGSRRVMGVTFESGRKLIYKPRGLRMDMAWHGIIEWLRARDPACRLRAPQALDRGDYGWVEFVEPSTPAEPAEYYRRAGELLALAWLCGGSDFHEENVIATAFGPVLIDLETLFTPTPRPFGATDEELAVAGDEQTFGTSVLSTLLLPVWQIDDRGNARDLSGLTGHQRELATWHEPQWVDIGTDRVREEMRPASGRQPHNIPRDTAGALIPATAYANEVAEGFRAAAQALLAARDDLPLEPFRGAEIRFLIRNTQIYASMRQRLRRPEFLHSAADRSIELEKLSRAFFPPDADAPRPEVFNCYEAERRGIENGDIPSFDARNDETTLHGDGGIAVRRYFWKTGWQIAQEKLRSLEEGIVIEQAALVRSSLELRYTAQPPSPTDWIGAATAIAEDLASRVIPLHTGGISWLSLGFDPVRKMQNAGLMGLDFYSGSLGVAVFLAALARVTGEDRWRKLAHDCTRPRLDQMRREQCRPLLSHMPLGLGSGLGSFVYGCQLLGELTGDELLLDDAVFFARLIRERADQDPSDVNDVLGGEAGAVLALLNLHRATGDESLVHAASLLGHGILDRRAAAASSHRVWKPEFADRPLTGLGHGAAGFAWALSRLDAVMGDGAFSEASDEALDYEREVFDAAAGNWPDFRRGSGGAAGKAFMHGWCAGQPGIGLARIAQFRATPDRAKDEIDAAVKDALHGPALQAAHLCCGQGARIEFLLEAARARADRPLREAAEAGATRILERRNALGHFPLNGAEHGRLFAPSFFQGCTGIGYTFLRLVDESLPAVSIFETTS